MRRHGRLGLAGVVALATCAASLALGEVALAQRRPGSSRPATPLPAAPTPPPAPAAPAAPPAPTLPVLRLGALLPISGPGAWFGAEIRAGLELALAELNPRPPAAPAAAGTGADAPPAGSPPGPPGAATEEAARAEEPGRAADPRADKSQPGPERHADAPDAPDGDDAAPGRGASAAAATPPPEPIEPGDRPKTVQLALEVLDVQPLDLRDIGVELNRLLASGVAAIFTASPTPTLAVLPPAATRSVLVVHAGLPTDRFPPSSRTLIQLRPSPAARARTLAGYAWERGIRRLGVLSAGDEFGRATRAAVTRHWRERGGALTHDESFSLDDSDVRSRLRRLVRSRPEAVVLGYQGAELGKILRAVRGAGYAGLVLAADDDRAALLAAGSDVGEARFLSDAFVPGPGSRGARFARAYEAKHRAPPSRFAAAAYEAAVLLADGAAAALKDGRTLSGGRVRDALLKQQRFPSLFAGELVVRDDGVIERPMAVLRADDGRLVPEGYVTPDGRPVSPTGAARPAPPRFALGR